VSTVGLLHPGAMGAAVGNALKRAGHEVVWASEGRSRATAARAARFVDAGTVEALLSRCDVVLSICPPDFAVATARAAAGFEGLYVDANAIAPATAAEIAAVVPRFVDGGIIGPPPLRSGTTRLYLTGGEEVAALFAGTRLKACVIEGSASALKMVYAAWTKGSAALLLAIEGAAQELGVAHDLHLEWSLSQPQLPERLAAAQDAAASKGWRWVGEMREIAATLAAAGEPDGFHTAAAEVYARATAGSSTASG
jgi:3-hydroxyisobutyrate dehydrogenase-like beta-hydroxyacid dehydrogenase